MRDLTPRASRAQKVQSWRTGGAGSTEHVEVQKADQTCPYCGVRKQDLDAHVQQADRLLRQLDGRISGCVVHSRFFRVLSRNSGNISRDFGSLNHEIWRQTNEKTVQQSLLRRK